MLHRVCQCSCKPTSGIFSTTKKMAQESGGAAKIICLLLDARPSSQIMDCCGKNRNHSRFSGQYDVAAYFCDGSGGVHSQDPRSRRAGWGIACLKHDAELKEACHGSVPGRQTVPQAEITALVVLAENIKTAGVYQVRVDGQYLFASIAKPARAKRGTNGDLWLRFSDACDTKPQCIVRVTRVWRSQLTAKELEIGCSTLFDMRGNTFANEMEDRAAARVEVLPSQANAVQAIDGIAWQVRMRIIEANLAAFFGHPMREFLPPRTPAHRKTGQQKRNELLETLASMGHAIRRRWSRREFYRCARCGCNPGTGGRSMGGNALRVPTAPTERCSDDEDPFGYGGALDA